MSRVQRSVSEASREATPNLSRLSLLLRIVAALAGVALSKPARAESANAQTNAASAPGKHAARPSLKGFDALATIGWGTHTSTFVDLELAPYGATFGVDLGYSWRSGFRLGGYFFHSLGHTLPQHREPLVGRPVDFTAEASSVNGGLSLGWGVPLYCFALRYKLSLGVTSMRWRFHDVSSAVAGFGEDTSPTVGFHIAPGVALLWPYGKFEGGAGFEYLAQIKDTIPSGFIGTLFLGVKL